MLQFLLLLKITRILERRYVVYVYTIARKVDRKGLIFAVPYSFSDNYKFKIKSIIYFNIDLNNFHRDFIFYILLRSYFDFSSRFGIEIFLRAMKSKSTMAGK